MEWRVAIRPILDEDFKAALKNRVHLIGTGDALDVEVTFKQHFDEKLQVYVTDPQSYLVTKVFRHVARD